MTHADIDNLTDGQVAEAVAWRPVVGWEGCYEVSDSGKVRSARRHYRNGVGFEISQCVDGYGYSRVCLRRLGSRKTIRVHRLVANAFMPKAIGDVEINHIDGKKSNNRLSNLEWVTHSENMKHASRNGLMATGDRNGARARALLHAQIEVIDGEDV